MFRTHRVIAASAAAALTLGGLIGGGIVLADANGGPGAPSTTPSLLRVDSDSLDSYIAKLAGNLGIDEATLREAITATNLDFLDAAVADGRLTEEQAAEVRERLESGEGSILGLPLPGIGSGFGWVERGDRSADGGPHIIRGLFGASAEVADFLGITQDELRSELESGKSLAEVGEAHGKTRDELKAFILEQADEAIAERIDDLLDRTFTPGEGRPPFPGGHSDGWKGEREDADGSGSGDSGGGSSDSGSTPSATPSGFRGFGSRVAPNIW